jgi:hypothetical protein
MIMDNDCCTYQCEGNKNCPVRATRRVRAGQPAPPILLDPEDFAKDDELPTWMAGLIVLMIMVIVALFAFGWASVLP